MACSRSLADTAAAQASTQRSVARAICYGVQAHRLAGVRWGVRIH